MIIKAFMVLTLLLINTGCTVDRKPGKSFNFGISFSKPGKSWKMNLLYKIYSAVVFFFYEWRRGN